MTDQQSQSQQGQQPQGQQQGNEDPEQTFWDKLGKFMDERIDKGVERAIEKHGNATQSRNERRTTVPGFFADLMFGPAKSKE